MCSFYSVLHSCNILDFAFVKIISKLKILIVALKISYCASQPVGCRCEKPDESRLYSRLQRVTIPDAVIIQFVLLKMGMLMLETCRGL
jgi:hypothetical protein